MAEPTSLESILDATWRRLEAGARSAKSAFHTGVLGTVADTGPELRTVVLRAVDPPARSLICHTDARSPKLAQLRRDHRVSWLFYDPADKIQIRLRGIATVHRRDELALERWRGATAWSRRCYAAEPGPGEVLSEAGSGLSADLAGRQPSLEESEAWYGRFAVIDTVVQRLDWLYLSADGHRRARFDWAGSGRTSAWIVP